MTVTLFAALAGAAAALCALGAASLAVVLSRPEAFHTMLGWVMARYSADGVLSNEGLSLITRTAWLIVKAAAAGAGASAGVAALLWRISRSTSVPDAALPSARPQPPEASWWPGRVYLLAGLGLVLMGAWLRVPGLATSLFYDEIFSITHFASLPAWRIPLTQVLSNNHILNSLLLHAMLKISSHEALLRLPVFLAGVGSLWLFFLLARRLGGPLAGVFAAGLAATSTYHLWYSMLARGYMLGLSLVLAGLLVVLHAGPRPSRRSCWAFGVTQVLAALALPTLALVPGLLLTWVLLGALPAARRWTGLDPRSPSGAAWLSASLWTVAAIIALHMPTLPVLLLRAASRAGGAAFAGESQWLSLFRYGWIGLAAAAALGGIGLADWVLARRAGMAWPERFLLALWACSGAWLFLERELIRIHVPAFMAVVVLVAMGLRALVVWSVSRSVPAPRHALAGAAVSLALLAGVTLSAGPEIRRIARAVPFEDIRGAVRLAEAIVPQHGRILTSGFADREIAYYASRQVHILTSTEELTSLASTLPSPTFCYFRLYPGDGDPVFAHFQASGPPTAVLEGAGDSIAIWCSGGSA